MENPCPMPESTYEAPSPNHRPSGSITLNLQMVAMLAALVAPLIGMAGYIIGLEARTRALEERLATIRDLEWNVNYLCNERRRDNQQAGLTVGTACR